MAVHAVVLRSAGARGPVVVVGCGMIGLLVIETLRARRMQSIIAWTWRPANGDGDDLGRDARLNGQDRHDVRLA